MILTGDIGGTKTNLAIFLPPEHHHPVAEATFKSAGYPSLEAIVTDFMATQHLTSPVTTAVFGVAGPVIEGRAKTTNLPWIIAEETLMSTVGLPQVKLLNDLEAIAYAVPYLDETDIVALNKADILVHEQGHRAVIAPGTGLGEAVLLRRPSGAFTVSPSEGGHTDFGPTNVLQLEMLRYLLDKFGRVSYERVCSGGLGIPNIYEFFKISGHIQSSAEVDAQIREATDITPVIVQAGLAKTCPLCEAVLDMFVSILGAEAGNLALKVMATGGVYLGGGMPPRILDKLKDGIFMKAFTNKGRFSDMLSHVPVYVILNSKVSLLGAAHYALLLEAGEDV